MTTGVLAMSSMAASGWGWYDIAVCSNRAPVMAVARTAWEGDHL
jgi:hypothetical protein